MAPLLSVQNLRAHFATRTGVLRAVDGLSFDVTAGETLAIVGESGCGKSVTSLSILRLLDEPPAKLAGSVLFGGRDLIKLDEAAMRRLRGNEISMIFQEPMTSLNPLLTVGHQLAEPIMLHQGLGDAAARARVRPRC
jgi:peptide/nickel transport system ATP-binding protein